MASNQKYLTLLLFVVLVIAKPTIGQNCPGLNVVGSFYDLPSSTPPNLATAQSNGQCYTLSPPYPSQVCFEYMVPFSDTARATFHLAACGSQSSISTGTYSGGCSGTASTNATFIGQSTYDNSCNLIGNYIAVGYCGGATSGDIITVCFDLNTSSACDPITICPMLFCNTSLCSTTLPIELLDFDAVCNDNSTLLKWSTASELNNDFFRVEKSNNGELFYEIATINGSGNSNTIKNYFLEDEEKNNGNVYYRLKQTDFNGDYSYSNIITKNCPSLNSFNFYPNPANEILNISLDFNITNSTECIITNSLGQMVLEKHITSSNSSINIKNLAKGIYQVQIIGNHQPVITKKFIKQ